MGGIPPLGYDVVDRCLVVNPQEAKLIKKGCHMAQGYLLSRPITQDALLTLLDESPDFEQWETHTDVNAESHGLMTQSRYPERSGL